MRQRNKPILFLIALVWLTVACDSPTPTPIPTPTLSPQAFAGKSVFVQQCGACHSVGEDTVIVGPSLAGIAAEAGTRVPGQDARTYLY
ncbi:MAG: c-type cytochrome, partial [Chloroflexi bacterium]|nr:c-type cytochrome [Chloroflexota bacterium]